MKYLKKLFFNKINLLHLIFFDHLAICIQFFQKYLEFISFFYLNQKININIIIKKKKTIKYSSSLFISEF